MAFRKSRKPRQINVKARFEYDTTGIIQSRFIAVICFYGQKPHVIFSYFPPLSIAYPASNFAAGRNATKHQFRFNAKRRKPSKKCNNGIFTKPLTQKRRACAMDI